MPKVRIDGNLVDVPLDALFQDDGNPFTTGATEAPTTTRTFTAEDIERARSEEKDKLYGRIEGFQETIKSLEEKVGSLTAAEQQRLDAARAEEQRLQEEARQAEEKDLDARSLIERRTEEWQSQLHQVEQTWEQRLAEEQQRREAAEAMAQREREFADLREYIAGQVAAHQEDIAPQLLPWINGNTREEVDAAIARAVETTNAIVADLQQAPVPQPDPTQQVAVYPGAQPVAPVTPGTRATGGPGNTDPAAQYQTLTAEQIRDMPMDQWAKIRSKVGVGTSSNSNRGLYG